MKTKLQNNNSKNIQNHSNTFFADFTLRDKRIWIKGLLVDCPLGQPLKGCPANALRNLPIDQFAEIVNKMTKKQINCIIEYHENCCRKRESN